jgi:glutathione synthase
MFAQAEGVRVLNDPRGLVLSAHKGWLATLPDVPQPRTLLTASVAEAAAFAAGFAAGFAADLGGGVVVKPTRAGGGRGVVWAPDGRDAAAVGAAVETARRESFDGYVVVQEYLPEAEVGEKRVLWVDGRVVGGYLRIRPPGDFRHNLKVGGRPLPCELTPADHALAEALTPHLRAAGVWFAGIDVIGGRVVEVNTLNPGGAAHAAVFSGVNVADRVLSSLLSPPIR